MKKTSGENCGGRNLNSSLNTFLPLTWYNRALNHRLSPIPLNPKVLDTFIHTMAELQRDAPLFDKVMVVKLQNGASPQETARQIPLTLRIINGTRPTANNSQSEKMVHIEVTDENDPYFLYILDVGEQDFHHLKRDQSLLVEFPVFPSKLIELIELCLSCGGAMTTTSGTMNTSSSSGLSDAASYLSSFSANLDTSSGVFSVIEANRFKQLTHISLQLRQGNDAAIKAYLASRLVFINTVAGKKSKELDGALAELEAVTHPLILPSRNIL